MEKPSSRTAPGISLLIRHCLPSGIVLTAVVFLLTGCREPAGVGGGECLAPAAAGGGWDLTCRAFARTLQETESSPGLMRVVNLPGAGGGIAYAHAVAQRRGHGNVVVAASPATLLRLAQGQFAQLSEDDVRWLGAIATDHGVVAVRADSPWKDLESLLVDWRRDPRRIRVSGGSAVGGQDHMKMLLLATEAGIDPLSVRYIPFDGGGEAMTTLMGGFVEVYSGDVTQVESQVEVGGLRVLAVLAGERVGGGLSEVPTARELGYPVEWVTWRGFYLPPDISDERYSAWVDVLQDVADSEAWTRERQRSRLAPWFMVGEPFEQFIREQVMELRELSRQMGLIE